ncbi:Glycerophosphoryl diester phosphodiesterase family-domain-containing protein [Triangularia verruculosa]|uniref:Glycerophosphoryl diester phosphodiesterase family-domain-containing protein n=1 Tax=Triangularia verruculosa TaxID=2587418 RepID=A0AAN7AYX6_9PEZI|nr:Glycerophosphoryl diester phosphodiesterase family-domain-containing protein [Triangularia verruculosa]
MRFGQNYHRNFIPEWSEHYIDYNLLKKHIKLGNVAEVYTYLNNIISTLETLYRYEVYAEGPTEAKLDKLQWFGRLNLEAIERIIAKLKRNGHTGSPYPGNFLALHSKWERQLVSQQNGDGLQNGGLPRQPRTANPLHTAIRHQDDEMVKLLVQDSKNLHYRSVRGETALHIAAQFGQLDYTALLLENLANNCFDHDITDISRGWTPLFFAAVDGHLEIVKLLLDTGANQQRKDHLGWTAKEYAVFKGHLAVAGLFERENTDELTGGPEQGPFGGSIAAPAHCAKDEHIIIATLGSSRKDRVVTEVDLSYCSSVYTPGKHNNVASFSLWISALGSVSQSRRVRLPILDDQINDPFIFQVPSDVPAQLVFTISRSTAEGDVTIGSGTALLQSNSHQFGAGRQSLIREQTVPILDKKTMRPAGTVTFTFLIVKPYPHELQGPQGFATPEEWTQALAPVSSRPVLVGHRGTGQNLLTNHLQIGENTIGSFLAAAKLGASFVEFDVQVTRDLQAICFHDFSLSESGTDVPVHDLTLDQFLYASKIQSPHGNPLSMLGRPRYHAKRPRSRSLGEQFEAGAIQIRDRMKHTVDFKLKGFKPNTRGEFIQDSFATLKDVLIQLPEDIGLDIEIKYPRLHEAADTGVAPVAIELNTFVDVALETIRQYSKPGCRRKIMLSSFTPEVCILLSLKQKAHPVFFITNAGKIPMADMEVRAASVQVAVRFARRWNLTGIVFACEALLLSPRLVGYVKKKGGLVCATYGELNNQPDVVMKQVLSGVDIIVADRVRLVADTLTVPN